MHRKRTEPPVGPRPLQPASPDEALGVPVRESPPAKGRRAAEKRRSRIGKTSRLSRRRA